MRMRAALLIPMYSASVVERATVGCLLLLRVHLEQRCTGNCARHGLRIAHHDNQAGIGTPAR